MDPYILDAWKYSLKIGILPPSHLESVTSKRKQGSYGH